MSTLIALYLLSGSSLGSYLEFLMKRITIATTFAVAMAASMASAQNLVTNGSFETEDPSIITNGYYLHLGFDPTPTGWTYTASTDSSASYIESIQDSSDFQDPVTNAPIAASDGTYYLVLNGYFGNDYSYVPTSLAEYDTMSTQVSTIAGATYNVSYDIYLEGSAGDTSGTNSGDFFHAQVDGVDLAGTALIGSQNYVGHWVTATSSFVGAGGSQKLSFSAFNNYDYLMLDNIVVTAQAAPEPAGLVLIGLAALAPLALRKRNA